MESPLGVCGKARGHFPYDMGVEINFNPYHYFGKFGFYDAPSGVGGERWRGERRDESRLYHMYLKTPPNPPKGDLCAFDPFGYSF